MIWINGENFFSAKENNLLYGPFTQALPNFKNYVDETTSDTCYDFAYPIEGYEAPYGKAQLVLINDEEKNAGNPFQCTGAARVCQKISGTGNLSGTS